MNMNLRFLGIFVFAATLASQSRADSGTNPDFNEVRAVLQQHMSGGTEAVLNQAAVRGLLAELKGRAVLVDDSNSSKTNPLVLVAPERRFDGDVGYLRIEHVAGGLPQAVSTSLSRLRSTNGLAGLVLDFRYANGLDYASAAATVDLFLAKEVPLINAGKGLVSSKEKTNACTVPVVALVNHETAAAAEALAAMLRQAGVGLLIGTPTAGRAGITSDYQLTTGQTLRVVTAPILLGDAKALTMEGVKPDVIVDVKPEDETKYYADPYAKLGKPAMVNPLASDTETTPTASRRVRVTEADLVREKRGDGDLETVAGQRIKSEETAPQVSDPALSRAIDLLKGLAVVRQWKS